MHRYMLVQPIFKRNILRSIFLLLLCFLSGRITAQSIQIAPTVSTLAGNGIQGYVNGISTSAQFYYTNGVVSDATGNIYVADYGNSVIRKITPSGIVSTFAGSGTAGYADGVGIAASFNLPSGIAIDATGNIYVADTYNFKIRKITPSGIVSTLAGSTVGNVDGAGTAARFGGLRDLELDAVGNIYVADASNHVIRKVTPAGVVTTLAGSGAAGFVNGTGAAASFNVPYGVAVDATGNVFVADSWNSVIRKITPAGVVTTFAGSGTQGYLDGASTSANLNYPYGLAFDASGYLYVAEYYNNRIRKISPTGVVGTFAGNGTTGNTNGLAMSASFNYPFGVAFDATGNLYVGDMFNHSVRKISTAALSSFSANQGYSSSEQNFTVSATALTSNLIISVPSGYEISLTSGSGYGATLNLSPTSGNVVSTQIFIRLSANASLGVNNGDITLFSAGAINQLLAVTGTVTGNLVPPSQPLGNRGMYFDGVNDYVNAGTSISNTINSAISNNPFSISTWVKLSSLVGDHVLLTSWAEGNGASLFRFGVLNGQPYLKEVNGLYNTNGVLLEVNKWTHVTVTYDLSSLNWYHNGVLVATKGAANLYNGSGVPVRIGTDGVEFFRGQIDEMKVFNKVLSTAEVNTEMGSTALAASCVTYWNFEDDAGGLNAINVQDAVTGNKATPANGPLWALRTTNTLDDGLQGSLRWAIDEANKDTDQDYIDFSIQQTGIASVIQPLSTISITESVYLDGYSAYGSKVNTNAFRLPNNSELKVEFDASLANAGTGKGQVLNIGASNSTLAGFATYNGGSTAININGTNNQLSGCYLGLKADGSLGGVNLGSSGAISLNGSGHTIGWKTIPNPAESNVLSNVNWYTIRSNSSNSVVSGNYFGTDKTGNLAIYTARNSIFLETGIGNIIHRNLLTGNNYPIQGDLRIDFGPNTITGNLIGLNADSNATLTKAGSGIDIGKNTGEVNVIGGDAIGQANTIAYHTVSGISLNSEQGNTNQIIRQNKIYCNGTGNTASGILDAPAIVTKPTLSGSIAGATVTLNVGNIDATGSKDIYFYKNISCGANQGETFVAKATTVSGVSTFTYSTTALVSGEKVTAMYVSNNGSSVFSDVLTLCDKPLLVTSTADDSTCGTLRYAIGYANYKAGKDSIAFNIPGGGVKVIAPLKPLPDITDALIIHGRSNLMGYANPTSSDKADYKLVVEIDGSVNGVIGNGLSVKASDVTIRSLSIVGFTEAGIYAKNVNNVAIEGNYLGLRANGNKVANGNGVKFENVSNSAPKFSYIGGGSAYDRNVICNNNGDGIQLLNSNGVWVIRNFIGVYFDGIGSNPNKGLGLYLQGSNNVNIGFNQSGGFGNVIAGNEAGQILLNTCGYTSLFDNYLGVGSDGKTALVNPKSGITFSDSKYSVIGSVAFPNTIANHTDAGISFTGNSAFSNEIVSNSIYANKSTGILVGASGEQENVLAPEINTATLNGDLSATFSLKDPGTGIDKVSFYADSGTQGQVFLAQFLKTPTNEYILTPAIMSRANVLTTTPIYYTAIQTTVGKSSSAFSNAKVLSAPSVPVTITDFTPKMGIAGTTVTITGTGFSTVPTDNHVWFGGMPATVTGTPTATSLQVTVPTGATYSTILVESKGLTAESKAWFDATLACTLVQSFAPTKVSPVVQSGNYAIVSGDFNNDGKADFASSGTSGIVSIQLGNGDGSFKSKQDLNVTGTVYSLATGDLNADGNLDLVAANDGSTIIVMLGNGDGTFVLLSKTFPTGAQPYAVILHDFDGDGFLDYSTANNSDVTMSIRSGNGDGTFGVSKEYNAGSANGPYALDAADFNGDGKLDIAIVNSTDQTVSVYLRNNLNDYDSSPNYTINVGDFPNAVKVGDFNKDGMPDLAISIYTQNSVKVLINNGSGFGGSTGYPIAFKPLALSLADFNGDGFLDISASCGDGTLDSVSILLGKAGGLFSQKVNYKAEGQSYGLATADFNSDNRPDLAINYYDSDKVTILLNTCGASALKPCAFAGDKQVNLTWPAISGATSYTVYYGTDTTATLSTQTSATNSATITGLSNDQLHFFAVSADAGLRSKFDAAVPVVQSGKALSLNGTSQYVTVPDNNNLDFLSAVFTLEAWVKFNLIADQTIISKHNGVGTHTGYRLYLASSDSTIRLFFGNGVNFAGTELASKTKIDANKWYHIAASYDKANSIIKVFINGKLDASMASNSALGQNSTSITFGLRGATFNDARLNGEIDEIRMWNVARIDGDIDNFKDKPLTGSESGLIGLWHFDEPSGNIAYDATCYSYNGTRINNPIAPASKAMHPYKPTGLAVSAGTLTWATPNTATDVMSYTILKKVGMVYDAVGTSDVVTSSYTLPVSCTAAYYKVYGIDSVGQIGVLSDSLLVANCPGAALDFDGVDDNVSTATNWTTAISNITLEAKVFWKGTTSTHQLILLNGNSSTNGYGIFLYYNNGSKLGVILGNVAVLTTNVLLATNKWQHVALTNDGAKWTLYLDGVPQILSTYTNISNVPTGKSYIGSNNNGVQNFYGTIDEVRIWSRALCEAEIQNNMSCEKPANQMGLLARYDFNQGIAGGDNSVLAADKIAIDSSVNNYHGTLSGFDLNSTTSNWVAPSKIVSGSACTPLVLPVGTTWTWTGAVSTDWFSPCNWDMLSVPIATSLVEIPKKANQPKISGANAKCKALKIYTTSGAMLELDKTNGGSLDITD